VYPDESVTLQWKCFAVECKQQPDSASCDTMVIEHAHHLVAKQTVNDINASPEGVAALRLRITSELLTGILQGIEPASPATVSSPASAPIPTDIATASVVQDPETPVQIPVKSHLLTHNDLEATKVFLPQTPQKMQQFSLPLLDHSSMLGVSPEVPRAMVSVPGTNDDFACLYSLEKVTEVVLGIGCIERLKAGETLKFQVFPDGLDQHTRDLLVLELRMYIHHSPVPLAPGNVLPNMVHSVLQQVTRQSLSVWVVSALLYSTHRVVAIPSPGHIGEKGKNDWHIDVRHLFEATMSLAAGISHLWTGIQLEPVWYPDGDQSMFAAVRIRSAKQWVGLHATQQANSYLGAVERDDEGFMLTDFSDHLATSATLNFPISGAMLGAMSWEQDSVNDYMATTHTGSSFVKGVETQLAFAQVLTMYTAMSIQHEYCRYGRDSWLVAYLRSSPGNDDKWVTTIKEMLADRWVDVWVKEETQPGVAEPSSALKRPASPPEESVTNLARQARQRRCPCRRHPCCPVACPHHCSRSHDHPPYLGASTDLPHIARVAISLLPTDRRLVYVSSHCLRYIACASLSFLTYVFLFG